MVKRRRIALLGGLTLALWSTVSVAHPMAPALLELRESSGGAVEVLWKRSSLSAPRSNIEPVVPRDCHELTPPRAEEQGVAVLIRWQIDCGPDGLVGRTLRVDGLETANIDTLVRIELADGRILQRVLRRSQPEMIVPEKAGAWAVFVDYLRIGFEHILSGVDHLLFVFGLYLLCASVMSLIKTVTAFTVGHSITLSLAALGFTNLPSAPIEVLIAASVLVLAVELARDRAEPTWMRRYPWPMAAGFGLLHGMGFAGALREVGLPSGEIPIALFSFNVGIETGQLVFVLALAGLNKTIAAIPISFPLPRRTAVYVMGSCAAFWMIQRAVAI